MNDLTQGCLFEEHAVEQTAIATYLELTKVTLPGLAKEQRKQWPVTEDHCFQRIVLDNVFGGVWYHHIKRPAYKHLTRDQIFRAVRLCNEIIAGEQDLSELNRKSLNWRGKGKPSL